MTPDFSTGTVTRMELPSIVLEKTILVRADREEELKKSRSSFS